MIKHLRIDNRLIHGQVAVNWVNSIGADEIIVCNDVVASDEIQKKAIPMAAKDYVVNVFSVEETINYVNDNPEKKLFVICKYPSDALAVLKSGLNVEEVNVGNAAPIQGTDYIMVTKSIAVTKDDAKIYRQIADLRGGVLTSKLTSMNEIDDFLELLSKNGL